MITRCCSWRTDGKNDRFARSKCSLACAASAYASLPLATSIPRIFNQCSPPLGTYLGFDRNDYPGDAVLDGLAHDFVFCGYWLNAPPGENSDTWLGKRTILRSHGFGFLVLFNGRLDKELKSTRDPRTLGSSDATAAVDAAKKEGFPSEPSSFSTRKKAGECCPSNRPTCTPGSTP